MDNLKGKTVLILGAGHVGEACAVKVLSQNVKKIILHTLTKDEAFRVKDRLVPNYTNESKIELSWGNALVTAGLSKKRDEEIDLDISLKRKLLEYYYTPKSEEKLKSSSLYEIIENFQPDVVVDAINTATVVGYKNDPYTLAREVLSGDQNSVQNYDLLMANPIPQMIRFMQTLELLMTSGMIESYVKVSTTGLGGMGVNLSYTHGDLNESGMSSGILGKVATAGIIHQLLWSLAHTPGCNVKVIAPATLIGWQYVGFGGFRSHGSPLKKIELPERVSLTKKGVASSSISKSFSEDIKIAYVDSGENNAYSLCEMMAITSLGQMEAVTREEVADAVLGCIYGSTKHDILTALDYAAMGPSYTAAIQRSTIFEQMRNLEKGSRYPSIATNNLGPTVSKHLFELFILMESSSGTLKNLIDETKDNVISDIKTYLKDNLQIIEYALSLKLPLIQPDSSVYLVEDALVPGNATTLKKSSLDEIEKYINDGWVDLRAENILYWIKKIDLVLKDINKISHNIHIPLERNWQNITKSNVGELLGYIYSMDGGNRKKEILKNK